MEREELRQKLVSTLNTDLASLSAAATLKLPPPAGLECAEPGTAFVQGEELGRGGMGIVYRARQRSLGRDVALKTLANQSEAARQAFFAEAHILARLEHPNIVPVHALNCTADGRPQLAMKLVRGRVWSELLRERSVGEEPEGALDFHLEILLQVCNAMAYAHDRGILHLDLKPANVMVGAFGEVQVMDWGLAVALDSVEQGPALRRSSDIHRTCGTPSYMAPELALGEGQRIGPATDIYLLGGLLYRILRGAAPRAGLSFLDAVLQAARGELPAMPSSLPEELRRVCVRALQPEPHARYPDVAAFRDALRDFLRHRESRAMSRAAGQLLASAQSSAGRLRDDDFAAAISSFLQAQSLWPQNPDALAGERQARLAWIGVALAAGDLALAEAQLAKLPAKPGDAERAELSTGIERLKAGRRRDRSVRRLLALALAATLVLGLTLTLLRQWEQRSARTMRDQARRAAIAGLQAQLAARESLGLQDHGRTLLAQLRARQTGAGFVRLSSGERAAHASFIRRFFGLLTDQQRLSQIAQPGLFDADPPLSREQMQALRTTTDSGFVRLIALAILNQSYDLAELIVEGSGASRRPLKDIEEARQAQLRWQEARTREAIDDLQRGRWRADRPQTAPTVDEIVIQLSGYKDAYIVGVLDELLEVYRVKAAEQGSATTWAPAERDAISVIVRALGQLELPAHTVPVLARLMAVLWDPELAFTTARALSTTRSFAALEPLVEAVERFGMSSSISTRITPLLARLSLPAEGHAVDSIEELYQLAKLHQIRGELSLALALFTRLAKHEMGNQHRVWFDRSNIFLALGQPARAVADLTRAIELRPDFAMAWAQRAMLLSAAGSNEAALQDLAQAIELDPEVALFYFNRASIHVGLDDLLAARADLYRALELDPNAFHAHLILGVVHAKLRAWEKALSSLNRALELDREAASAWVNRANVRLELRQERQAIDDYTHALGLDATLANAWSGRGRAYLQLELHERALEDLHQAQRLAPDDASVLLDRAEALAALGRHGLAMDDLDRCLVLTPESLTALKTRGRLYFELYRFEEALADFDRAIALDSERASFFGDRATIRMELGDDAGARRDLARALQLEPDNAPVRRQRGRFFMRLGETQQALVDLDRAIESDPGDASAYLLRSELHRWQESWDAALDDANRALDLGLHTSVCWLNRAIIQQQLGAWEAAQVDCEKALEQNPAEPWAWVIRGDALGELGQLEEADRSLSRALELAPTWWTYYRRAWLRFESGDASAAVEDFEASIAHGGRDPHVFLGAARAAATLVGAQPEAQAMASKDRAFSFLEQACSSGSYEAAGLRHIDAFGVLADDPRWEALLQGLDP